ncbi:Nif3-like dinuclear metal center hexameric protein [Aquibacillus salsiterrae]|uniref:Nif3-like dinuclear metal center hexameric protein n=1 Tax=Aquibacillus salsiterrae TaxID=2950439 RepID=UPI002FEE300F
MSEIQGKRLVQIFEAWAPKSLAYQWDSVGLQIGSLDRTVQKVMVTLDVIESVVDEAVEKNVDLIIAHHPILFSPLKQINVEDPKGRTIEKLIKNNITVYAAHTNLDITSGGVSDIIMDKLSIHPTKVLVKSATMKLFKLIVYVPESHASNLIEKLGNAGAGHLGNYSHCSFTSKGVGAFKPLKGSNPHLGEIDSLKKVNEVKVETIIREDQISHLLTVITDVHPYEEVAYDLIPLWNKGNDIGAGRIGQLKEPISLKEFCQFVKDRLDLPAVRVIGDLHETVKKIAVLGGSGEDFIETAISHDVDVYLTGDLTFHDAQDGWQAGLKMIDVGHYVENHLTHAVKHYLEEKLNGEGETIEIIVSSVNTDPFQFL